MKGKINIINKKAKYEYEILDKYNSGLVLAGSEIKSIRLGKVSINESFCEFNDTNELFVINMNIEVYSHSSNFNHFPKSSRKLLLNKKELAKLNKSVKNSGLTIIPLRLYLNENGLAKLEIALVKGKKMFDKRQTIIDRDNKRSLNRIKKEKRNF
jgi:SsrA-binding protein